MKTINGEILGLDLGKKRTGVARMHTNARISEALDAIDMANASLSEVVTELIATHDAVAVVVGMPRGLDGQETEQTDWVREQLEQLKSTISVPVFDIDEAGTTKAAEKRARNNESVDSVAAGILLEDFVNEVERGNISDVTL